MSHQLKVAHKFDRSQCSNEQSINLCLYTTYISEVITQSKMRSDFPTRFHGSFDSKDMILDVSQLKRTPKSW